MFTSDQKRQLKELGKTTSGRLIIDCIEAMEAHYSSVATIDRTRSTDAQIEGRQILTEALKEFKQEFHINKVQYKPVPQESWE